MANDKALTKEAAEQQIKDAKAAKASIQQQLDGLLDKIKKTPSFLRANIEKELASLKATLLDKIKGLDAKIQEGEDAIKKYTGLGDLVPDINLEKLAKDKLDQAEQLAKDKLAEAERLAKEKLAEAEKFAKEKAAELERLAREKLAELERLAKEKLAGAALEALKKYADGFGSSLKGKLFDLKPPMQTIPICDGAKATILFAGSIEAGLTTTIDKQKIEIKTIGTVKCAATAAIVFYVSFKLPLVGTVNMSSSMNATSALTGTAEISLKAPNLTVLEGAAHASLLWNARLIFSWDTGIPNRFLKYVANFIKPVTVNGSSLVYDMGNLDILTAQTPYYTAKFVILKGEFSANASGSPEFKIHPAVAKKIADTKKAINDAIEYAMSPSHWF